MASFSIGDDEEPTADPSMDLHRRLLEKTIAEACIAVRSGEGSPYGAVITNDAKGIEVVSAHNESFKLNDPTAHAEVIAIRKACEKLQTLDLRGCTLYSSCQPCQMCEAACVWARIDKVYYAATSELSASYQLPFPLKESRGFVQRVRIEHDNVPFEKWKKFKDKSDKPDLSFTK